MLQDTTLEVKGLELLNNTEKPEWDMILINYLEKQDFIEDCPFGNVILAAFTTAHARLHLYETLEKLGDRVLYFDTDSIIYQHVEGLFNPTIVNSLGGWTDELLNSCLEDLRTMPLKQILDKRYKKSKALLLIIELLRLSPWIPLKK